MSHQRISQGGTVLELNPKSLLFAVEKDGARWQTSETPYSLQYQLFEGLKNGTEIPRGDLVTILSTPVKETESLEEFDFLDNVLPVVGETPLLHD